MTREEFVANYLQQYDLLECLATEELQNTARREMLEAILNDLYSVKNKAGDV